jgi:hypothetical protein
MYGRQAEGNEYYPKCETFVHKAKKYAYLQLRIHQTMHSFFSKENSEY